MHGISTGTAGGDGISRTISQRIQRQFSVAPRADSGKPNAYKVQRQNRPAGAWTDIATKAGRCTAIPSSSGAMDKAIGRLVGSE